MVKLTRAIFAFAFVFIFVMGIGSALISVNPSPVSFSNPDTQKTVTISNNDASTNFTFSYSSISFSILDKNDASINFIADNISNLMGSDSFILNIRNSSTLDYSKFSLGKTYSTTFNLTGTKYFLNSTNNTEVVSINQPITVQVENTYCKYGALGNVISIDSVDEDNDFEWEPLMDVEVEVQVENNDDDSSKRAVVKLVLYDLTDEEFVEFEDGEDELEETIRISDDDEETVTFNFRLPATIDQNHEYKLYVKAYESGEEDTFCDSEDGIDVDISSDYEVVMDDLDLPSVFVCGDSNLVSLRVYNLDLGDEEEMRVNLYNQELGLNLFSESFELDNGDDGEVLFNVLIPENKEAKSYRLSFYAEYDYKESTDTFRDAENLGTYTIRLEGDKCKADTSKTPTIAAVLDEETKTVVGKDLVIKMTVTNPGNTSSFILALEGYDSWADSAVLNQTTFNLGVGKSEIVIATFNPTMAGTQEFTIKTVYGGRILEQKVTVVIEENQSWFSRALDSIGFKGNLAFWLTVAIFIVLILIILVLIVKFISSSNRD